MHTLNWIKTIIVLSFFYAQGEKTQRVIERWKSGAWRKRLVTLFPQEFEGRRYIDVLSDVILLWKLHDKWRVCVCLDSDSDSELSVDDNSSSYASSHSSDSEDDARCSKTKWNNERLPNQSTPKGDGDLFYDHWYHLTSSTQAALLLKYKNCKVKGDVVLYNFGVNLKVMQCPVIESSAGRRSRPQPVKVKMWLVKRNYAWRQKSTWNFTKEIKSVRTEMCRRMKANLVSQTATSYQGEVSCFIYHNTIWNINFFNKCM